jgi:beta-glucosidase
MFQKEFMWGVATSSYQIEGAANEDGRGPSIWDTFAATPGKVVNGETGLVANDHYHLYKDDVALMKNLGVKAYRFSISWSRLFPNGDSVREERGFDFYNKLIDELVAAGIEPVVTLYHWDLPQALEDKGGWADRQILDAFEFYAGAVAEAFGDRVKMFSPINEPWCVAWLGYGIGIHAPGLKDYSKAIVASHHTVVAHNRASKAIRAIRPDALVGPVLNQSLADLDDITDPKQLRAALVFDTNQNTFWMDGIFRGEYPATAYEIYGKDLEDAIQPGDLEVVQNDWLGINYYNNMRIGYEVEPVAGQPVSHIEHFAGFSFESSPFGDLTDMGWPINPAGLGNLLSRWTREFQGTVPPMFITENGAAFGEEPDEQDEVKDSRRIEYLNDHILEVGRAIDRGANVGGYFQWSLMDNFEWAEGYGKRFGIVHVDFETQKRTLKNSAKFYAEVVATNGEALSGRNVK